MKRTYTFVCSLLLIATFLLMPLQSVQAIAAPPSNPSTEEAINPLTGLPVDDPAALANPPALISVTNWPSTARPQAGLDSSAMVYELYIGEGMSRFLAMFYGDYPKPDVGDEHVVDDSSSIGPIRSGRLPYQGLRKQYNGFLVMASAYAGVAQNLQSYNNVFGTDNSSTNTAMIPVTQLESIAEKSARQLGSPDLNGMVFSDKAPSTGVKGDRLWFLYNQLNQVIWQYNAQDGAYHRLQFTAEKNNTFVPATDRLNENELTYENIIVMMADHRACTETAFDINFYNVSPTPAWLFRDGKLQKIYWTTQNGEYEKTTGKVRPIRFVDEQGQPVALKPGQTWVHLVPAFTTGWETPREVGNDLVAGESIDPGQAYNQQHRQGSGTGAWAVQYFASMMTQDPKVCDAIRAKP